MTESWGNNAYHGDLLHIGVLLLVVLPELLPAKSRPNRSEQNPNNGGTQRRHNLKLT